MKNQLFVMVMASMLGACSQQASVTGGTPSPTPSPVVGATGASGQNGVNGTSCTASAVTGGIDITCGSNPLVFLANGSVGATGSQGIAGTSCTATSTTGGVDIKCGSNTAVFLANGSTGSQGAAGQNGNGYNPGLGCDVYSVPASGYAGSGSANSLTWWDTLLSSGTLEFSTVLSNFDVPNESDKTLFTGFTAAQYALLQVDSNGNIINWAMDCEGNLTVPETGLYNFTLGSDDGSAIIIDNNIVINMPDTQAYASASASNVQLDAGPHKFNLLYAQTLAVNIGLTLQWQGPSNSGLGTLSIVPASAFTH